MKDLKSMTVGELREDILFGSSEIATLSFDELASRLEEAEQKIVAQQARLAVILEDGMDEYWITLPENEVYISGNDLSVLAAHDAEVAAKALEETAMLFPADGYMRFDLKSRAAEYRANGRKE